jgi:hypothetical protein
MASGYKGNFDAYPVAHLSPAEKKEYKNGRPIPQRKEYILVDALDAILEENRRLKNIFKEQ